MRMGIAPDRDGGALGQEQIALTQFDALALVQIDIAIENRAAFRQSDFAERTQIDRSIEN